MITDFFLWLFWPTPRRPPPPPCEHEWETLADMREWVACGRFGEYTKVSIDTYPRRKNVISLNIFPQEGLYPGVFRVVQQKRMAWYKPNQNNLVYWYGREKKMLKISWAKSDEELFF